MLSLLRRTATAAGLAASAFSTSSQAQDSLLVQPERPQLRRALPAATAPVVQQSPNGLYQLSVTDAGIELRGPKGVVKITEAGVSIVSLTTPVEIHANDIHLKGGRAVTLVSGGSVDIRGSAASLIGGRVTLGCPNGRGAARVGDAVNTSASPAVVERGSQTVLVC